MITVSQTLRTGSETKGLEESVALARKAGIKNPKLRPNAQTFSATVTSEALFLKIVNDN